MAQNSKIKIKPTFSEKSTFGGKEKNSDIFLFFKPSLNINSAIKDLRSRSAEYLEKKGEQMALNLFHWMTNSTPAYLAFLNQQKFNPSKIKNIGDFKMLPLTSKDSYLCPANYQDLFPNRDIISATTISATSGSTGEPFYFPRSGAHDDMYQYEAEIFLKEQFGIDKKKTLAVLGFGLGIWIGGIFTYRVLEHISQKGYPLTIVPAGTSKEQFMGAIKKFGKFYDQIILMGYPPFIKDVLDEGENYGIRFEDYEIKILTAAEGYSEKFREYLAKKAGLKNMLSDTINIYGTVELGTMAHETAISNLIRHLATKNKKLFQTLFPEAVSIPTVCQYYPHLVYFEEVSIDGKREIVGTGYGAQIPLIRYRFKDFGGVIPYKEMIKKLALCGFDLKQEMKRYGIKPSLIFPLPFVYVYARSDSAVVFRGANIYQEEIHYALNDNNLVKYITGRFTMIRKEDKEFNQILEINVELRKNIEFDKKIVETVKEKIISHLRENNSEYNDVFQSYLDAIPTIILLPYNHPRYFNRAGKQKWVEK